MSVTLESVQSNSSHDSSLTITKPTSLAEGDLLVAGILLNSDGSGSVIIDVPSGWTEQESVSAPSSGNYRIRLSIFTKEADSSDVAASNFTFTESGTAGTYNMIGHLARVSDFGLFSGSSANVADSLGATIVATGFTPSRTNTLFLGFLSGLVSGVPGTDSISLATDDPTWTEEAETNYSDSNQGTVLGMYSATRAEDTATGDITGTVDGDQVRRAVAVISLSSKISGSVSQDVYVNAYAFSPNNEVAIAETIVPTPTSTSRDSVSWSNDSRPSLAQSELNATTMSGDNRVYMSGDNKIYREEGDDDWANQTRP